MGTGRGGEGVYKPERRADESISESPFCPCILGSECDWGDCKVRQRAGRGAPQAQRRDERGNLHVPS